MKKRRIKVKLSQCMIVKNEEKNIRRALSWGRGIVSEQIVVDTGSTDRTVEIAKEMGAKVYHFKWVDDFSAAKNYAIKQAEGNWIAFLDADEYFSEESAKKLIPVIERAEELSSEERKIYAIRSNLANVNDNGKLGVLIQQDRIFRNDPGLRYQNRIHEGLRLSGSRAYGFIDAREELLILHSGYTWETYEQTGKLERNIHMLEEDLKDDPESVSALAYLGDAYLSQKRFEKAKECFRKAADYGLKKGEEETGTTLRCIIMLLILYAQESDTEQESIVRELHGQYLKLYGGHPDGDCYFGAWLYQTGRYTEAEKYLRSALEKMRVYRANLPLYMTSELKVFYVQLADCCRRQGKKNDAVRYLVIALGVDKYYTEPLVMLLNLLKGEQGEAETASGTWNILSQLYDVSSLKDQMTILKGAKLTAFAALEKRVFDAMPEGQRRAVQEALHKKAEEIKAHAKSPEKAD